MKNEDNFIKAPPTPRKALRKQAILERKFSIIFKITLFIILPIMTINLFSVVSGMKIMYVVSNSMQPVFSRGDLVLLSERDFGEITEGDIIAYYADWHPEGLITHRVISKSEEEIITKGDANNTNDPSITKSDVAGEVVGYVPKLGLIFNPLILRSLVLASIAFYIFMLFSKTKSVLKFYSRKKKV